MEEPSDETLFVRLKCGDEKAFTLLFNRYFEPLYRHAAHLLNSRDAAYDIVQDVFAVFWDKRNDLQVVTVRAYLYASIRNAVLNEIRRSSRFERHLCRLKELERTQDFPPDSLLQRKQLEEEINRAIDALPSRMKQVFLLRREEELSYTEVAEQMGISKLTVKTQMNKALHLLWKRISIFLVVQTILLFS